MSIEQERTEFEAWLDNNISYSRDDLNEGEIDIARAAYQAGRAAIYAVPQPDEPSKGEPVLYASQKALDLTSRSDAVISVGLTRVPQMSWNVPLHTAPQPAARAWPDPDEAWKLGAVPFSQVAVGTEIICTANGGRWRKTSETAAICTETDSAYQAGETAKFGAAEMVVLIDAEMQRKLP